MVQPGPLPGARPRVGARMWAPGGRASPLGARPGSAPKSDVGPHSRRLTTCRRDRKGPVHSGLGCSRRRGPWRPDLWTRKLALGMWNVTSLVGKEPELVREVERYQLEIVGITSTHSLGSGTTLLERGWTLYFSGVGSTLVVLWFPWWEAAGWCGIAHSPPAQLPCVGVHLWVRDRSLTVFCAYWQNGSTEYPALLESWGRVLESALTGDSIVLLGDSNAHGGSDIDTWSGGIGRNGPPDLNPSGVLLLDFCASYSLSWTPSWGSVLGVSHWEETLRKTQDMLKGLCLPTGLGTPRYSPGGAGGSV